jgi:very-short-patch-repair endonuclease
VFRFGSGRVNQNELPPPWIIAARQHGVVKSSQLGLGKATIAEWVRAGHLHPLYRGVYAYGHTALSQKGKWMAAILAAGDGAVLARMSAAALVRITKRTPARIDVLVPKPRKSQPGFRAHTCRNLDPRDVVIVDGIPVTTVARLLVDLSDEEDAEELANLMHEAAHWNQFDFDATVAAMGRANGRRNLKVLKEALRMHRRGSAGSRSRLEKRFRRLVIGAGLPTPATNVVINGFEVDAYWPGLCVEIDGYGHRRERTQVDDRIKDAALRAAGYTVLRFSEDAIAFEPESVLAQLAAQQLPRRVAGE